MTDAISVCVHFGHHFDLMFIFLASNDKVKTITIIRYSSSERIEAFSILLFDECPSLMFRVLESNQFFCLYFFRIQNVDQPSAIHQRFERFRFRKEARA